jgi:hypothetical protein
MKGAGETAAHNFDLDVLGFTVVKKLVAQPAETIGFAETGLIGR